MSRRFSYLLLFVAAGTISAFCFYGAIMGYSRLKKAHAFVTSQGSEGVVKTAAATIREAVRGGEFLDPVEPAGSGEATFDEIEGDRIDPHLAAELRREGFDVELLQMVRNSARIMLAHPDPVVRRRTRNEVMEEIKKMDGNQARMMAEIEKLEKEAAGGKFSQPDKSVVRKFVASVRRSYEVILEAIAED